MEWSPLWAIEALSHWRPESRGFVHRRPHGHELAPSCFQVCSVKGQCGQRSRRAGSLRAAGGRCCRQAQASWEECSQGGVAHFSAGRRDVRRAQRHRSPGQASRHRTREPHPGHREQDPDTKSPRHTPVSGSVWTLVRSRFK